MKHSLLTTLLASSNAWALSIALPDETARFKDGPGLDIVQTYCYACHSADYIITQPPHMPRAFWQAEVEKMKNAFGAPIPDDQVPTIVEYLVKTYGK